MGLFRKIKDTWELFREFKELARQEKETNARWEAMTLADAGTLNDEDLWACVSFRLEVLDEEGAFLRRSKPYQVIYTAYWFDAEVQNGGLCQYFVNSSRMTAPYLDTALNALGAGSYRKLFLDFVAENNLDLRNLSSFDLDSLDEFEAQNQRYPFDAFDDAYYELYEREPLEDLCAAYVRKHLEEFFQ